MSALLELIQNLVPSIIKFIFTEIDKRTPDEDIVEKLIQISDDSNENRTKMAIVVAKARILKELE